MKKIQGLQDVDGKDSLVESKDAPFTPVSHIEKAIPKNQDLDQGKNVIFDGRSRRRALFISGENNKDANLNEC